MAKSKKQPPAPPPKSNGRGLGVVVSAALAVMTLVVYGQTIGYGFIGYDDDEYVYENPMVSHGLTRDGIVRAFTTVHSLNWHPLTWLSHALDCQLYGLRAGGHHLTNILFHAGAAIGLFWALRRMTGALWRSAFVAAVFAAHPLRVESVAWLAERKDVLSGFFFVLTLWAYERYARGGRTLARYGLVVLFFALGLMSKPMLVTAPLVLLLLDYWPLQRKEAAGKLVVEKIPLLALSGASCAVTLWAQQRAVQTAGVFPLTTRLGNAVCSVMVYLREMIYPANLGVLYPLAPQGPPGWQTALAAVLAGGISLVAVKFRRTKPFLLTGWLWYLVMLIPVIGIVQAGIQAHADRYTYLPGIGIAVAATWLAAEQMTAWKWSRVSMGASMAAVAAGLMACACQQTSYWKDGVTLWMHTVKCAGDSATSELDFGSALQDQGKMSEAISHYQMALRLRPDYTEAFYNIGNIYLQGGQIDEAMENYQRALQLSPDNPQSHYNIGNALREKGRAVDAMAEYQKALQLQPAFTPARYNLALMLAQQQHWGDAIGQFRRALELDPNYVAASFSLADALFQSGQADQAIVQYRKALGSKPDAVDGWISLGGVLLQQGKYDDAADSFRQALKIQPGNPGAQAGLDAALNRKRAAP